MDLQKLLHDVSSWSIILPLLLGSLFIRNLTRDSLLILAAVILGSISQLINFFYPNAEAFLVIIYNLYTPAEFIFFYALFANKWLKTIRKQIFEILGGLYLIISICIVSTWGISNTFISSWAWINNLFYVVWIMMLLYEQYFKSIAFLIIPSIPFFWFVIGILFYAPCTMLAFSMWDYMEKSKSDLAVLLKIIHHIFNINMYIFFTIGILIDSKKLKNPHKNILNH